jgi:hypothetical protein
VTDKRIDLTQTVRKQVTGDRVRPEIIVDALRIGDNRLNSELLQLPPATLRVAMRARPRTPFPLPSMRIALRSSVYVNYLSCNVPRPGRTKEHRH